jgi:hypothetical protein
VERAIPEETKLPHQQKLKVPKGLIHVSRLLGIYEYSGLTLAPLLSKKAGALCHLFIIFFTTGRRAKDSITALQKVITSFTCSWTACAQA